MLHHLRLLLLFGWLFCFVLFYFSFSHWPSSCLPCDIVLETVSTWTIFIHSCLFVCLKGFLVVVGLELRTLHFVGTIQLEPCSNLIHSFDWYPNISLGFTHVPLEQLLLFLCYFTIILLKYGFSQWQQTQYAFLCFNCTKHSQYLFIEKKQMHVI